MKTLKTFIFLLLPVILYFSCQKDDDTTIPEITVVSPAENTNISIPDTITVEAYITDKKIIENLTVVLVTEDFKIAGKSLVYRPENNRYHLNIKYVIDDKYLPTGNYYLQIKATNETDFKNKYVKLHITELPVKLEKVIVITKNSETSISVNGVDLSMNNSRLFEVNCPYAASAFDKHSGYLFIAGKKFIDIATYDMALNTLAWEMPPQYSGLIRNDNSLCFNEFLFAGYNMQYIAGYETNGMIVFNAFISFHDKPCGIFREGDYLLVDMRKQNAAYSPELVTFWFNSGTVKQTRTVDFNISGIYGYTPGVVLITGNSENGILMNYDIENDYLFHLSTVPGTIKCAEKVTKDIILIGTGSKIYKFNCSNLMLQEIREFDNAVNISYDSLNGYIYLSSPNTLYRYTYPDFYNYGSSTFQDTIKNVHLYYNK